MPIRVFLVEDHAIVRQGIKLLLQDDPEIIISGEANNGAEAIGMINMFPPDIVLMDLSMPVMNGIECTRLLKKQFSSLKVLVLSMHDHESYLIDMLDSGADGYILKTASREELLFAIKHIMTHGPYIGAEFTIGMLAKYKMEVNGNRRKLIDSLELTEKEREVLHLIAEGFTNFEMSQKLLTSVRTIESRRKNLLTKTGTVNTATLIRFATRNGLIM